MSNVIRPPLPSTGSPWVVGFPRFSGTTRRSDSPCAFSPRSLPSRGDTVAAPLVRCSGAGGAPRPSPGGVQRPPPAHEQRSPWGLPGSWGARSSTCPALGSRWADTPRPLQAYPCCLPLRRPRRPPRPTDFGTESHGLLTCCLRFAAWVAPGPRKTRYPLPAKLGGTGLATRWTPKKVSMALKSCSTSTRLGLAQRR